MNDVGLSIEFIDYGAPWLANYCTLVDADVIRTVLTQRGDEDTSLEATFSTSSHSVLSNTLENLITDEDCPVSISLEQSEHDEGSVLVEASDYTIDKHNTPYYGVPIFTDLISTPVSESNRNTYVIGLQQSDDDFVTIREGMYIDSKIMFVPENEKQNIDGTYKRVIYNQAKNLFYKNYINPVSVMGSNSQLDPTLDGKNQILFNKLKTVSIPQAFIGEKIIEKSVEIVEKNGIVDYTIVDDGNGNLHVKDRMFSVIVDDQNRHPLFDGDILSSETSSYNNNEVVESELFRDISLQSDIGNEEFYTRKLNMGYSVGISDTYAAIGIPCFEKTIPEAGVVDVYNFNKLLNDRFVYSKQLKRKIYSVTGSNRIVVNNDYGSAVDICNSTLAVSSNRATYYFENSSSITYTDNLGVVEIYDLSVSGSNPVDYITSTMIPCGLDVGNHTFGKVISVNDEFIAIGCPYTYRQNDTSSYQGCVYMFSGSITSGYEFQTILTGSNRNTDVLFGRDLKLDKKYNKLVVGNGNFNQSFGSSAYLFEYISGSWVETYVFNSPTKSVENLNFINLPPYNTSFSGPDAYGTAVSIYCSSSLDYTIAIGAPFDRTVVEYSGSLCNKNGAVYIYDHEYCILTSGSVSSYVDNGLVMSRVSGNEQTFKNNRFGHSIDLHNNKLVVSSPKYLSELPPDYYNDTYFMNLTSTPVGDESYLGMVHIYEKIPKENLITFVSGSPSFVTNTSGFLTGSVSVSQWQQYATHKPKKMYGSPHCFYAYDVATFGDNMIVGNPIVITIPRVLLSSMNARPDILQPSDIIVDIPVDKTKYVWNLQGNFNILNFTDYESLHHIGNVFYRNGKLVLSTTGSIFDTVFETTVNEHFKYDITFENAVRLYEKEIVCTINPGEFNYSTNPTSYNYSPISQLDLNKNGKFDFEDCDKILRGLYYKFTGTESWWDLFDSFTNTSDYDTVVENSLYTYYISGSVTKCVVTSLLTDSEKSHIINDLNGILDINGDGVSDYNDIKILWKYFSNHLTIQNVTSYQTTKCIYGSRPTYDLILSYLNNIAGNNALPTVSETFYSNSTTPTSSYLTPYITTIGLYTGGDLIAIAKLGTPIKNLGHFPLNFIVRFDM